MNENNENNENTANTAPSVGGDLRNNEYVVEMFAVMEQNGKDTKGLAALIGHVSDMESFVKRAEDKIADMKSQLAELKDVQNHPVKNTLQRAITALERKVAEVKEHIAELKQNIIEGCKSAVEAFKEKGASALNNLAKFFRVKGLLKGIGKDADMAIRRCDKAIASVNNFSEQYHAAGSALRNMGRIFVGKEPIDAKKEAGIFAKGVSAPYRAQRAIQSGIKESVDKAVAALEGMEERQAERKAERKTGREANRAPKESIIGELEESKEIAAELNRSEQERDRTKVKNGAEL